MNAFRLILLGFFLTCVSWQSAIAIPPTPQFEVESNDSFLTANPILLDSDSKGLVVGSLSFGDNDYFSFAAPAGSRAWILVDTGGDLNPDGVSRDSQVSLLDTDGTTLIEFDDDDGTGTGCDGTIDV